MRVNIKLDHPAAQLPKRATSSDAGFDLTAADYGFCNQYLEYDTGLCLEIPEGHVGLLFPRSSLSKYDLVQANHVGVIDAGYRGRIKVRYKLTKPMEEAKMYKKGDKICQLVVLPIPEIQFNLVEELTETQRGDNGFGSSGN